MLQRGWEEAGMLRGYEKGRWMMSPHAEGCGGGVCYLGLIWHTDGERSQNKNQGEAVEEWLYLSGNSR